MGVSIVIIINFHYKMLWTEYNCVHNAIFSTWLFCACAYLLPFGPFPNTERWPLTLILYLLKNLFYTHLYRLLLQRIVVIIFTHTVNDPSLLLAIFLTVFWGIFLLQCRAPCVNCLRAARPRGARPLVCDWCASRLHTGLYGAVCVCVCVWGEEEEEAWEEEEGVSVQTGRLNK